MQTYRTEFQQTKANCTTNITATVGIQDPNCDRDVRGKATVNVIDKTEFNEQPTESSMQN